MTAQPSVLGAHLLFEHEGAVLLGKRAPDAVFAPDTWHLPAGHVEAESARACAVREAAEELALALREEDLHLVHVVDLLEPRDGRPRAQLFFRVTAWRGEPGRQPLLAAGMDGMSGMITTEGIASSPAPPPVPPRQLALKCLGGVSSEGTG
jgi:ADP-ribose pyrophosphatase YjhB (NUDIX family)